MCVSCRYIRYTERYKCIYRDIIESKVCISHSVKFFSALHKNAPSSERSLIKIRFAHTHTFDFCVVSLFLERLRLRLRLGSYLHIIPMQFGRGKVLRRVDGKKGEVLAKGDRHHHHSYKLN